MSSACDFTKQMKHRCASRVHQECAACVCRILMKVLIALRWRAVRNNSSCVDSLPCNVLLSSNGVMMFILMIMQEILEVEQLMAEEDAGMELTAENVERSLDEIRCKFSVGPAALCVQTPYLLYSIAACC